MHQDTSPPARLSHPSPPPNPPSICLRPVAALQWRAAADLVSGGSLEEGQLIRTGGGGGSGANGSSGGARYGGVVVRHEMSGAPHLEQIAEGSDEGKASTSTGSPRPDPHRRPPQVPRLHPPQPTPQQQQQGGAGGGPGGWAGQQGRGQERGPRGEGAGGQPPGSSDDSEDGSDGSPTGAGGGGGGGGRDARQGGGKGGGSGRHRSQVGPGGGAAPNCTTPHLNPKPQHRSQVGHGGGATPPARRGEGWQGWQGCSAQACLTRVGGCAQLACRPPSAPPGTRPPWGAPPPSHTPRHMHPSHAVLAPRVLRVPCPATPMAAHTNPNGCPPQWRPTRMAAHPPMAASR